MTLENKLKAGWEKTKDNFKTRRYLHPANYVSDIFAGSVSRLPFYSVFDNGVMGVSDEKVIGSSEFALVAGACGWSLLYTFGHSMLATSLGATYQKNSKKIDALYSTVLTFGFGMVANLKNNYTMDEALWTSAARAAMAIPLGPLTRYYTDAFREMRGENPIAKTTKFRGKGWRHNLPRAAAMSLIPLAIAGSIVFATPKNYEGIKKFFKPNTEQVQPAGKEQIMEAAK